jgi:hypothetical protein
MLRTWQWAIVSSLSVALLGCPGLLKKKGEDAGEDAGPAASASAEAAAPVAVASNDSDVTHYPDQAAANNETLTTRMMAAARTEASATGGKLVAELKAGTQATKLADHEGFDLVVFPDPKDATNKLEGWVHGAAFGWAPPPHVTDGGTTPPATTEGGAPPACKPQPLDIKKNANGTCNAGYASCGAMCRMSCKADADCCLSTAHCQGGYCLGPGASPCGH